MIQTTFFLVNGLAIISGVFLIVKSSGWPSGGDRKNKISRSIKGGLGGTLLAVGLTLIYFFGRSPDVFWRQLSFLPIFSSLLCVVIQLFVIMVIASFIQFSAWDRTESFFSNELGKIIAKSRTDKK